MKLRKERSIVAVYDAVSISKDIEVSGGPLTLNFYAESRSYIPNRFITPIILTPKIYVVDPNKVIADGDKHTELTECIWYMNGERIVSDDNFKINKDNTLTVFKNSERDYTISYSATWFDTRKKLNIYIEDSVQFITIALGDGNLLPRINIDKAQNWIHNPLKGEKKYSIKAYISKDKVYEGAVEWYYNYVGKPLVLFDEKCKFYVKGLYTNELIIDSSKASNCVITAKNLSKEKLQLYYWFFDENGNPISNNEPVYKEISSKEPITLPVDTIEIAAKYNILGDTLLINNPSLLNITDEEFNKAYGINPEWDNHMEEVFGKEIGGRNLVGLFSDSYTGTNAAFGYGSYFTRDGYEFSAITSYPAFAYKVIVPPSTMLTLSLDLEIDTANSKAYFKMISNKAGGGTEASSPGIKKSGRHTFTFLSNANGEDNRIGFITSDATMQTSIKVSNVKLEKGNKATPYTPAPEDLNYRNLVANGDFRNASDAPWIVHNSVSFDKGKITSKNGGYMDISQPYRAIVGHLYYGRIKVNKDSIHLVFSNRSWESRKNIAVNDGGDYDYFKEISGIGKPVKETTYISLMAYPGSGKEKIWTVEYCYLIDLTEKFGSGNEPTLELCDEIFVNYGYIPAPEDLNYPTIKPTTIESVLLPLTINSVSSTIGGLEKSSMEIKKSLGKNEGLTATQLVQNGDFSDGTKGWDLLNATLQNGVYRATSASNQLYQKIQGKPSIGDVIYVSSALSGNGDNFGLGDNNIIRAKYVQGIQVLSNRFNYSNGRGEIALYDRSSQLMDIHVDYIKVLNLTQLFGKGNEPTKEWCDEHFKDYFDGTLLINIPIKKEDLSQYKITNLSSLKRLGTSVDYIENGTLHKSIELINFTGNETWVKEKAYSGIRYHMVLPYRVQGELLCNNFPTYNTITDLTTITPEGFSLVKGIYDKIYFTASDETTKPNENTQLLLLLHKPTSELLNTSGAINMKQGGTIFVENIITTDYLYNKGITLTSDYSIKLIISLTDNTSSLDINKCVIKDNIITHPDLQNGAYGTITYEYNSNNIKGLTTMKYMNVSDLLDTLWLEDIYTYKAKINPTGNITEWELVKLTDIENYEEWLSKDKLSENNLAPDGIIPGRYSTSVKYMRLYPSSLYVDFLAPTIVKDGTTKIKARAIVGTTDGILENPSQFFKVTWLKRNIKPGQLDVVIGTGNELVIDISNKDSITIEIEELPIK